MGDLHLRDFLRSSWIFAGQFFDSARSDPGNKQSVVGGTQKKLSRLLYNLIVRCPWMR